MKSRNNTMELVSPLIKLHKELLNYKYGIKHPSTGKLVSDFTEDEFNSGYRSLSVEEFRRLKGGVCWDYTNYYNTILTKRGYDVMNIFICIGTSRDDFYTHTVTIVAFENFYVWLESAWGTHKGVYLASDWRQLLGAIVHMLISEHDRRMGYEIRDYGEPPTDGTDGKTYLNYLMTSKLLHKGEARPVSKSPFTYDSRVGVFVLVPQQRTQYILEEGDDTKDDIFLEGAIEHSFVMKQLLEERIFTALKDPQKKKKFTRIQSEFIDRNAEKLATAGPEYLIVFGDKDKNEYLNLFGITKDEIVDALVPVLKKANATADFKFLTQHWILPILYFCIRYFTITGDTKGVNSTLGMYALDVYWSTFTKYYPKGVIGPVMAYTIDNMTEKFTIKKAGNIFNVLLMSISQSYTFHKKRFLQGGDDDICGFAQRIKNDQNSMFRKITNQYMENYKAGNAVTTRNDDYDADNPIVDDIENATTLIATLTASIVPQMISNGVDLRLATVAAKIAQISVTDCREYLTQLICDARVQEVESLVQSTLYLYLITEQRSSREIKSQYFLTWGYALFKKTNSKDPNINNIDTILKKWATESGIMDRYSGKGTRTNYKKAIFIYVILTIQKYMN